MNMTYQTLRQIVDETLNGTLNEQECYRRLAYHITQKLGSRRASIWYFQDEEIALSHVLYDTVTLAYSSGYILRKQESKDFFVTLRCGHMVSMPNVRTHYLATSVSNTVLIQSDSTSLFATPIIYRSKSVGFVCSEHSGNQESNLRYSEISYLDTVVSLVTHLLFNLHQRKY